MVRREEVLIEHRLDAVRAGRQLRQRAGESVRAVVEPAACARLHFLDVQAEEGLGIEPIGPEARLASGPLGKEDVEPAGKRLRGHGRVQSHREPQGLCGSRRGAPPEKPKENETKGLAVSCGPHCCISMDWFLAAAGGLHREYTANPAETKESAATAKNLTLLAARSIIAGKLSAISYQLSAFGCQLSAEGCPAGSRQVTPLAAPCL
jgi:hypothetical protein